MARLQAVLATGKAGAETLKLADYLATAKRGRQPFGARHLWFEIGRDNDDMRTKGVSLEERLQHLALEYHMSDRSKLQAAIAEYEKVMAEVRTIEQDYDR